MGTQRMLTQVLTLLQSLKGLFVMDDALALDSRLQPLISAIADLSERKETIFQKTGHIADLIEQAEDVLESPESVLQELRAEWAYFPPDVKKSMSDLVLLLKELPQHQTLAFSLASRALLLIPSIRRRKNLYGIGKRFFFDVYAGIVKINEAWNELNVELSVFDDEKMNWGIYKEEELDSSSLLNREPVEAVDWGEPQGVEVW